MLNHVSLSSSLIRCRSSSLILTDHLWSSPISSDPQWSSPILTDHLRPSLNIYNPHWSSPIISDLHWSSPILSDHLRSLVFCCLLPPHFLLCVLCLSAQPEAWILGRLSCRSLCAQFTAELCCYSARLDCLSPLISSFWSKKLLNQEYLQLIFYYTWSLKCWQRRSEEEEEEGKYWGRPLKLSATFKLLWPTSGILPASDDFSSLLHRSAAPSSIILFICKCVCVCVLRSNRFRFNVFHMWRSSLWSFTDSHSKAALLWIFSLYQIHISGNFETNLIL